MPRRFQHFEAPNAPIWVKQNIFLIRQKIYHSIGTIALMNQTKRKEKSKIAPELLVVSMVILCTDRTRPSGWIPP